MTLIQEVITAIRIVRAEWGVPPAQKIKVFIEGADKLSQRILDGGEAHLVRLAGLDEVEFQDRVKRHPETVVRVVRDLQVHVPLAGIVNRQDEANRVAKELLKIPVTSLFIAKSVGGVSSEYGRLVDYNIKGLPI